MGREVIGNGLMGENWLVERFILWIPLVLSLSVHEWAHAASAKWLGDDTAERLGRLSLNPLDPERSSRRMRGVQRSAKI